MGIRFEMGAQNGSSPLAVRILHLPHSTLATLHDSLSNEDSSFLRSQEDDGRSEDTTYALLLWQGGGGLWSLNSWYHTQLPSGFRLDRLGTSLCPFMSTFVFPPDAPTPLAIGFSTKHDPLKQELAWLDRQNPLTFYPSALSLHFPLTSVGSL